MIEFRLRFPKAGLVLLLASSSLFLYIQSAMWYNWMMKKNCKKFKMTLVKGGGNSFGEALRNSGNKIDVGVDEVLFTVDEDGIHESEVEEALKIERKSSNG